MRLYNTLAGCEQSLEPSEPGHVRIYVCGPTVYDYPHLGHIRCYVIYDVLVRHLRASGQNVTYVRNVTDVDDRIIARATALGEDPTRLAERFRKAYEEDLRRAGNLEPDIEPRVSEHIDQIRALVESLLAAGVAYVSEGDVYFHVPACAAYGKLSRQPLADVEAGASGRTRPEECARKKHPADFALWKRAEPGEPSWPSPWGAGRPGWHIECSAMSMHYLGESFDLHGGGLDLVFPHHENELAQSECATGQRFVTCWMHNGFLQVNKEKMSKSLGNFFTARQIFRLVEPEAVRYAMLTAHYRAPLNLDWEVDESGQISRFPLFEEAEQRLEYLYRTRRRLDALPEGRVDAGRSPPPNLVGFSERISDALDQDLNLPVALAHLACFLKAVNDLCDHACQGSTKVSASELEAARAGFAALSARLGLGGQVPDSVLSRIRDRRAQARGIDPCWVQEQIAARAAARSSRDFKQADSLRAQLLAKGIELLDSPAGTTWRLSA
ncbi:MAG: cysteine--tRNA ligase [Proteobacteria bacterium]|nr:cysteine--tRNA ligase [Pseudomonadota bacterium]